MQLVHVLFRTVLATAAVPALYASDYTDEELDAWAKRVRGWLQDGRDVYVYFDNDAKVHAPHNAMQLADLVGIGTSGES